MTLREIHNKLVYQCSHQRPPEAIPSGLPLSLNERIENCARIDISRGVTVNAITRLIETGLVMPPANFDLDSLNKAHPLLLKNEYKPLLREPDSEEYHPETLNKLIEGALLTRYSAFEVLSDCLMLSMSYGNGRACYCSIEGKILAPGAWQTRISFDINEGAEFWFENLCGYKHYPAIPLKWLEKRLDPSELNDYEITMFNRLREYAPDGEFWQYHMSPEERGPLCDQMGYAIVLDGIPVKHICVMRS